MALRRVTLIPAAVAPAGGSIFGGGGNVTVLVASWPGASGRRLGSADAHSRASAEHLDEKLVDECAVFLRTRTWTTAVPPGLAHHVCRRDLFYRDTRESGAAAGEVGAGDELEHVFLHGEHARGPCVDVAASIPNAIRTCLLRPRLSPADGGAWLRTASAPRLLSVTRARLDHRPLGRLAEHRRDELVGHMFPVLQTRASQSASLRPVTSVTCLFRGRRPSPRASPSLP